MNIKPSQLPTLDDDALDVLAAELRGWKVGGLLGKEEVDVWCTGEKTRYDNYERQIRLTDWTPTTNYNQSRELLDWAAKEHSMEFMVRIGNPHARVVYFGDEITTIQGNSPRAETTAFCAAMLVKMGRNDGR